MRHYLLFTVAVRYIAISAIMFVSSASQASTFLWAWDRPEDLKWIPANVSVAYFAMQFDARDSKFILRNRRPVLRVRPDTNLLPVLHIEAFFPQHPPAMGTQSVNLWADALSAAIFRLGGNQVQIDFEARSGQRDFYRSVLFALRDKLPPEIKISITALASWCGDPEWLATLPVDEIVPMYFRMGPAERHLWRQRMSKPSLLPQVCRNAAGIATDEAKSMLSDVGKESLIALKQRKLYLFSPKAAARYAR